MEELKSNVGVNVSTYLAWCARFDLTPCDPVEFLAALKLAASNELPHLDKNGFIYLRDISGNGTSRNLTDAILRRFPA